MLLPNGWVWVADHIEENFLDDKSNGFQVQVSKLDEPDTLSRLFFILAVAPLYFSLTAIE